MRQLVRWFGLVQTSLSLKSTRKMVKPPKKSSTRNSDSEKAFFVKTDIGNEKDIDHLAEAAQKRFGKVDVVLNNATVFPMGAIKDAPLTHGILVTA